MTEHDVWVVAQHRDGELHESTFELAGEGARLARAMGGQARAVLIGHSVAGFCDKLASFGLSQVYTLDHPLLARYSTDGYTLALAGLLQRESPRLLLLAATPDGRDLAPRLAARLAVPLVAGCVNANVEPNGDLSLTKPVFSGKLYSKVVPRSGRLCIATYRPGAIGLERPNPSRKAAVTVVPIDLAENSLRTEVLAVERADWRAVGVDEAAMVVGGGRGVQTDCWALLQQLGQALGAAIGGSRVAMDAGHVDRDQMIGLSGKTIGAKLYVAVGISGASHHLAGIRQARVVVALNSDPSAPLVKQANLALVGDAGQVIPAILRLLADSPDATPEVSP